jgi:3-deoxy-D-manno-octulosonic-acid transferase
VLPRLIYSFLLALLAPLMWLWLFWRERRGFAAWQPWVAERFARYPLPWDGTKPIWVHAASVGEIRAAKPLIRALVLQGETVLLTHFTPTGWGEGRRVLEHEIRLGQVWQQWLPYDFSGAMRRFWRQFDPQMVILIEREVWPNLVAVAKEMDTPVVLASGRLSERSLKRITLVDRLFGGLLHDAYRNITMALAQSDADAARLYDAGVSRVQVCGNLKFDMELPHVAVQAGRQWRERLARPIVAIASTREGEDKPMVGEIRQYFERQARSSVDARPLFLLIPRHPQRFDEAARHLDAAGCRYARWSVLRDDPNSQDCLSSMDVVLGDTMGEMPFFYAAADMAIVGGGFENHGGQNFIEACAIGTAVIVGPHTNNFAHAVDSAKKAGAIIQVQSVQQAFEQITTWLQQPEQAAVIGRAGHAWVASHLGATSRMLHNINELRAPGGVNAAEPD